MATERSEDRRQQVEHRQHRQDDERRPPRVPAVGVGVEAHEHVRQPHRAQADGEDQRQADVERMPLPRSQRMQPGAVAQRRQRGDDRDGVARRQPDGAAAAQPVLAGRQPHRPVDPAAVELPRDLERLGTRHLDGACRGDRHGLGPRRDRVAGVEGLVPVQEHRAHGERRDQQREELQPELQRLREGDRAHATEDHGHHHDDGDHQAPGPHGRAGLRAQGERRALHLRHQVEHADQADGHARQPPQPQRAEPQLREVR